MKTIEEWYDILTQMTQNTEYEVIMKANISKPVVAIVPRNFSTPQRVAVYPKKTKNAGLVFEYDVFQLPRIKDLLGDPSRIKSNRPHYNDISDKIILEVCRAFLSKT